MRTLTHIFCYLLLMLLVMACAKEQAVPVTAGFEVTVIGNDYSVPVQVAIVNHTKGAEEYEWSFEGAEPSSSTLKTPGTILYNTPGTYTIALQASNSDGITDRKEVILELDAPLRIDFEATIENDNYAPVTVNITSYCSGATTYQWHFEGGNPATSDQENPGTVLFETPGEHLISLEIGNGSETQSKDTLITVAPYLVPDFDWEVAFQDKDLQVPVILTMQNTSISATAYSWSFQEGTPAASAAENPIVVFDTPGTKTITLTASNGKESDYMTKEITLYLDTNIKVFQNIQLGINTAHNGDAIGSFFSAYHETVYTASEVTADNGASIDLVFFGLNAAFSFNRFYAPDTLDDTPFAAIVGATHTQFINFQEGCNCGTSLSAAQFDAMTDDSLLQPLIITATNDGLQAFDNTVVPRVVLFETEDGRKGAIKITAFVADGANAYIEADIKVQKQPN
ncbi:MAG: PKD domain-containing protein [Bacteroidota bacterium]